MTQTRLIAGAMSGTSADGVDIALTRVTGRGLDMTADLVLHHHRPYDPAIRSAIFAMRATGRTDLRDLARLGRDISLTYAAAVSEALHAANLKSSDLAAIAAHGQTLFHDVPLTIQHLDPSLLAYETGVPVVSDFRRADLAAGGQGAPLVPFADYILFRHPERNRVLLNLGGIANITLLPKGVTPDRVIAFDTGPSNCVSDHLCRRAGLGDYDAGGQHALRGRSDPDLLRAALSHPYFAKRPPKSTDGPEMIDAFESALTKIGRTLPIEDLLATACQLTADSVLAAIRESLGALPDELIASGGGTQNAAIMRALQSAGVPILRTDDLGVRSDAKEALAFALLGAATLDNLPSNVPSVTGARRGVILGSITPNP